MLWILRDFHLGLVDEGGAPLTADAYLEDELGAAAADADADADASRARARSVLRSALPVARLRAAAAARRVGGGARLAAARGGGGGRRVGGGARPLRAKLGAALRPKRIGGWTLDGKGLAQLAEETVRTLQGGGLPDAPALCRAVVHAQAERALRLSLQAYRSSWAAHAPRMPLPEAELTAVHRGAKEAARAQLHELAPLATASSSPGRWRSHSAGSPVRRGAADEIDAALAQAVEGQRRQWLALNGERAAERCAARLDAATHALLRAALPPGARPPGTAGISAYEAVLRAEAPPRRRPRRDGGRGARARTDRRGVARVAVGRRGGRRRRRGGGRLERAVGGGARRAARRRQRRVARRPPAARRRRRAAGGAEARRRARRAQQSATEATAAAQAARSRSLGLARHGAHRLDAAEARGRRAEARALGVEDERTAVVVYARARRPRHAGVGACVSRRRRRGVFA